MRKNTKSKLNKSLNKKILFNYTNYSIYINLLIPNT
jgi:hypothetical protein